MLVLKGLVGLYLAEGSTEAHSQVLWVKVKVKSLSRVLLFATPWTVA